LHPVFAKQAMSRGQGSVNPFVRLLLGHGDQRHTAGRAAKCGGGGGDFCQNLGTG
jgi:hypothetical protein